jgi:hypothetical protein
LGVQRYPVLKFESKPNLSKSWMVKMDFFPKIPGWFCADRPEARFDSQKAHELDGRSKAQLI